MMFYGGNSPVRRRGDRAYWSGIVPGDSSATLWSELVPFDQTPKTLDPPTGWVQNANDPPWWSTFPVQIHSDQFPNHLATRVMALRPQRSARMLDADSSITWEEFLTYQRSTRMELADRVLDDLLPAALASANGETRNAASVLQSWDRSADTASHGAALFVEWWAEYARRLPRGRNPFAVAWSERAPRTTPDGLADTAVAVSALQAAAETLTKRYGSADVAWGVVYRLRRDGVDLPAPGASGEYGVFKVLSYTREKDGKFAAVGGTSYVGAVEFSSPVRAMTLVGYGNASRAGSPHRVDQLKLFAEKRYKPALRTRREVENHLELREALHR
jgi:acyl-homoserine-lactone acylase